MRTLKIPDSNHFIGGSNGSLTVMRFKGVHSPRVNKLDWDFVAGVCVRESNYYTSIEVHGRVIQNRDLQKLIFDLESSKLLINREGYCYLKCEIQPPPSSSGRPLTNHFDNIQYYRLNDLFMWWSYQVNPLYTFNWNRHDIHTNQVIIDTNTSKMERDYETRIQNLQVENNKKLKDLKDEIGKLRDLQGDNKNEIRLQNKLDETKYNLQCLRDENKKKLQDLVDENKILKGLRDGNEKKQQDLRDENKRLQVRNEEKVKDLKEELQYTLSEYKNLQNKMMPDLQAEKKKVQNFVAEIKNLKELQVNNEKKLRDLQDENKNLKGIEKKLQDLCNESKRLQVRNEEKVNDMKEELKYMLSENKNLRNKMIPDLHFEKNKVQDFVAEIKNLKELQVENEKKLQDLQEENKNLKGNEKKLQDLRDENKKLQVRNEEKVKDLKEELQYTLGEYKNLRKKMVPDLKVEKIKVDDLVAEIKNLKELQVENEKKLYDLQQENRNLKGGKKKLQEFCDGNKRCQVIKVLNEELQYTPVEYKNLKRNMVPDLRVENNKVQDFIVEIMKLKELQVENEKELLVLQQENINLKENEKKLKHLQLENKNLKESVKKSHDLQQENKNLHVNEKMLQSLQDKIDVLQRELDNNNQSPMSSQPPPPPPPPPPPLTGRYSFQTDEYTSILRYFRPSKPDQFIFEIQCFTDLKQSIKDTNCDKFESPEFEVAGQKWKMSIYLDGIPIEDTDNHISLYLKKQPDQCGRVENIQMLVRFFIYSHKYKEYLTIQELIVQNFDDQIDMEAGIPQALKITDFYNINNGFVYGGKCRFGIEVFNMKSHPQTFTLTSVKKLNRGGKCICNFNYFSKLPKDAPSYSSDEFKIEIVSVKNRTVTYFWKVQIYPTGIEEDEDKNVSVFLELVSTEKVSSGRQLFADFELRLKCHDKSTKYYPKRRVAWFTQTEYNHGFDDFIPINEFEDGKYIDQDSITVEVYFYKMFRMEDV